MTPQLKRKSHLSKPPLTTDLLILPDGRVLAHNLTPLFADLLKELNPRDEQIAPRARSARFRHSFSQR
jgi:hypothetical protein